MASEPTVAPGRQAGPAPPTAGPESAAQERLAGLLGWIDAFDAELEAIYADVPAPDPAEADAMEAGALPESLAHSLRTSIECLRRDWLPVTRAVLKGAVETRSGDLEREWCRKLSR